MIGSLLSLASLVLSLQSPADVQAPTAPALVPGIEAEALQAKATDVVGSWRITNGKLMNGAPYAGKVDIKSKADFFELEWTITGQPKYGGVGFLVGDKLGVGWGTGADYGVVVYDIAGGKLSGSWTVKGATARGVENLDGPASLDGTYKITKANGPEGKSYSGDVTIKPHGATYELEWKLGKSAYKGVGIKDGNKLIVGWSVAGGAGIVLYKVQGKKLDGVWSNPGEGKTSVEVLEK